MSDPVPDAEIVPRPAAEHVERAERLLTASHGEPPPRQRNWSATEAETWRSRKVAEAQAHATLAVQETIERLLEHLVAQVRAKDRP